ncbi:hypoxanthine phosphoribosyltransferase [Fluviispira multicolorata]|uniref:Hypoxanthine phosphoribosyltransferase n=1 Tax=Fluviispira multicolorata TaxID=2654512 RepID=A0A833JEE2_9BACT|nr:hypoxanthine phosphoribosyltransferase [Fluviispira multicolorata]KAB8033150.1 hypoxanthine phosphoribosyltransferase [Fluviispira multicolorata]
MQIQVNDSLMNVNVLFSEADIRERIKQLSEQINKDYGTENTLIILIVLHGALLFASDLVRNLGMPTEIETVRIKSYEGTSSTGNITLVTPLPKDLTDKQILVIEDIVDTGRSIDFLLKELRKTNPKSIKVCSLLDKPEAHEFPVKADYVGFEIAKHFVIGYGLDLDGKYRNLPYVADLKKA